MSSSVTFLAKPFGSRQQLTCNITTALKYSEGSGDWIQVLLRWAVLSRASIKDAMKPLWWWCYSALAQYSRPSICYWLTLGISTRYRIIKRRVDHVAIRAIPRFSLQSRAVRYDAVDRVVSSEIDDIFVSKACYLSITYIFELDLVSWALCMIRDS